MMDASEIRNILAASAGPFAIDTLGGESFRAFRAAYHPDDRFKFNDLDNIGLEYIYSTHEILRVDRVGGDIIATKWPCGKCGLSGYYIAAADIRSSGKVTLRFECERGHRWFLEVPVTAFGRTF
jgi:hypothetical protein